MGINTLHGPNQDLQHCPLYSPPMRSLIRDLARWLNFLGISPYDLQTRNGELKYLIVTEGADHQFLVRLVVRSHYWLGRLRAQVPMLQQQFPEVVSWSVNIHPEHAATLAGEEEHVLAGGYVPVKFGEVTVLSNPESFLQTNTFVATALYTQATRWLAALGVSRVLDLFCGVGSFALAAAKAGITAHGVESDPRAVEAAQMSAQQEALAAAFTTADATNTLTEALEKANNPQAVIVNPPRRGIGAALATDINNSGVPYVLYSSCNPQSFAQDLTQMTNYRVVRIRPFDMFPHTAHVETLSLMTRTKNG